MELKKLRKASNPFPIGLALMISDLGWSNMTNKGCGVDEADVASYRNIELMACWSSVTSDLLMRAENPPGKELEAYNLYGALIQDLGQF
jgi:hypothetical protein